MTWMNEYEIDSAIDILDRAAPQFLPYARFLADWRDVVNDNSDGWAYWKGGIRPAAKLMALLQAVVGSVRSGTRDFPDEQEFKRALSPIKAAATKHGLPCPDLQDAPPAPAP